MTATEQERSFCEPEGELLKAPQGTGVACRRESQSWKFGRPEQRAN